jgi:hypothetical protein
MKRLDVSENALCSQKNCLITIVLRQLLSNEIQITKRALFFSFIGVGALMELHLPNSVFDAPK